MKRCFLLVVLTFFALQAWISSASAADITEADRTLPLNEAGDSTVLSVEEYSLGQRLFGYNCSQCHIGGITKTNPNVGLGEEALSLATPPRNNIENLVDYLKNPTTYDGEIEIYELHPSTRSADIYPEMRNLSEDDLYAIAGYILVQPKVLGDRWGG
ncbi:MAG: photosystem II cytochrome c-550 [Crocosphaera sp.]|nr:photosystem II cytochrome c-550 [Crocosphaera sp.]